jgi:hypothetical protein
MGGTGLKGTGTVYDFPDPRHTVDPSRRYEGAGRVRRSHDRGEKITHTFSIYFQVTPTTFELFFQVHISAQIALGIAAHQLRNLPPVADTHLH